MDITVSPARAIDGVISLPGDKSISHRYGMLGGIAEGVTTLHNYSTGADCQSTLGAMAALGAGTRAPPTMWASARPPRSAISRRDRRIKVLNAAWTVPRNTAAHPSRNSNRGVIVGRDAAGLPATGFVLGATGRVRRAGRWVLIGVAIGEAARIPLVAINDALYANPEDRALQDVLTCVREKKTIDSAGRLLEANAERHLKESAEMARLFRDEPAAIAERCSTTRSGVSSISMPTRSLTPTPASRSPAANWLTRAASAP